MGCCHSTGDETLESEETVKEVLVEVVSELDERVNTVKPPENQQLNGAILMVPPPAIRAEPDLHGEEIVSDISEVCSFRESFPSKTHGGAIAAPENRHPAVQPRKVAAVRWRRGDGKSEMVGNGEPQNDVVPREEAESLENPVISLECFVFL
ncbi:glucose-6-phosphate isomerase [Striga asiatica]|uniref:Glucose-6-phosphate isomerase n=1 Tax=Striga asiatica TaxID=4170 RepID=A0A5A7PSN0_STRAF|nr:glucose-6-phosphate isomerase [Striga asiatica]